MYQTGESAMTTSVSSHKLRITFLLPIPGDKPCGGIKVIYEYANFMAAQGHRVTVLHPNRLLVDKPLTSLGPKAILRSIRRYVKMRSTRQYRPDSWFRVHPEVDVRWVFSLDEKNVPDADVVVASAWETAEWIQTYSANKGKKFYLIQHLETFTGPEQRVFATWTAPLRKIVIAPWLQRLATEQGQSSELIWNGLDFLRFKLVKPIEERDPKRLIMLYHVVDWKGSAEGLAAFSSARKEIPDLHLTLFSLAPRPADLPDGIDFYHQPTQEKLNELYNEAAIFISPSWAEGWALPPAEAQMCGAALAVTNIGGHEAYAQHEQTALLSPIKDSATLAKNIVRLVRDQPLRIRLAQQGHSQIQQFTWQRAGKSLETLFERSLAEDLMSRIEQESLTTAVR
jgi:glycosyltransferase involved in cell wall biosynthesis